MITINSTKVVFVDWGFLFTNWRFDASPNQNIARPIIIPGRASQALVCNKLIKVMSIANAKP